MDRICGFSGCAGVHAQPADAAAAQAGLTRVSSQYPIYVAEPSKHYQDWWELYGEERFHAWLELQG